MGLERLARQASTIDEYPFPYRNGELDFRALLTAVVLDRLRGRAESEIARAFQRSIANGVRKGVMALSAAQKTDTVVLSGGVFQNELLLSDLKDLLQPTGLQIWTNHVVPPNDGGIGLGQAALAVLATTKPNPAVTPVDAWMEQVT